MGKKVKKWYVVVVGKDVGVFDSWTEASPLISGIPGALHESFASEEEAYQKFRQERDKGNTKVVRSRSQKVEAPSPMPVSPVSPVQTKSRTVLSGRSSSRSLVTPQSRRSPQPATPVEERAASPTVLHTNVTYTRGPSSSPDVSPRASRRAFPRVVVRTPPDILPYPGIESGDPPSTPPFSLDQGTSEVKRSPRPGFYCSSPASISPKAVLLGVATPPSIHAVVQTPSQIASYQTYDGGVNMGDEILSPLRSPKFYTPENVLPPLSTTQSSTDHSHLPTSLDHNQCWHTCPNCQHAHTYVTGPMVLVGFSQNSHTSLPLKDDPRSPTMNAGLSSGQYNRPSPAVETEGQLSSLFISA